MENFEIYWNNLNFEIKQNYENSISIYNEKEKLIKQCNSLFSKKKKFEKLILFLQNTELPFLQKFEQLITDFLNKKEQLKNTINDKSNFANEIKFIEITNTWIIEYMQIILNEIKCSNFDDFKKTYLLEIRLRDSLENKLSPYIMRMAAQTTKSNSTSWLNLLKFKRTISSFLIGVIAFSFFTFSNNANTYANTTQNNNISTKEFVLKGNVPQAPKGYEYWKSIETKITGYIPHGKGLMAKGDKTAGTGKTSIGDNAYKYDGIAVAPNALKNYYKVGQKIRINGKKVKITQAMLDEYAKNSIPYRTLAYIPGVGFKEADDTGGGMRQAALMGEHHIDVRVANANMISGIPQTGIVHLYKKV